MGKIRIFGDSTCDLNKELRDKYDIDYTPMNYVLNGKEYCASLDWEGLSAKDFYNKMREGERITTTQVPAEVFKEKFTEAIKAGDEVLYIGCSSALSGSVNLAQVVRKELLEEYPDAKIRVVDPLNSCFGQGMMLIKASELRAEGKTLDEIGDWIDANKLKYHQLAAPDKLSYLKRAGRVTASSAFFGNLIGIKPILISDAKGQNFAVKKVKGAQACKDELVKMTAEEIRNPEDQIIYISHADDEATAKELAENIKKKTGCKDVILGYIGPIVGASVGPGTIGIYFIGDEISILYDNFIDKKNNDKSGVYCYWNYYCHKGDYSSQFNEISNKFIQKQKIFEKDPVNNTFKEVVVVKLKEKNKKKIEEILDKFASDKRDVFCPFFIFLFENMENEQEKVTIDEDNYYLSPLKIFTFKFDRPESQSIMNFHKCLFRICSYYNELGDQFLIWVKDSDQPIVYDLINAEFNSYINIFCLGKTGSGKSTFLNKFFGEKKSKQGGTGRSTTTKIVRFGIDNIPVRIFDIPGFEDEQTIELVNNKLKQTANEMTSDKDKIHLILYFINNKEETLIYKMEKKIIETLKENNRDVRILFILTHATIDPDELKDSKNLKQKKKLDIIKQKIDKAITVISSTFGSSYGDNYFQKDSNKDSPYYLIPKNLIFVNMEKDYETDKEPFGFDKVIQSIYNTIIEGNDIIQLGKIKEKIASALINKRKNDENLEKEIKVLLSSGYLLRHISFDVQKERVMAEAQKLYDSMFSIGKTILVLSPFVRDIKLGVVKYQKYQFKKNLNKIFGFNIRDKNFDEKPDETNYEKMNRQFLEEAENKDEKEKKEELTKEIRKDYQSNEVNSAWIVANEVAGLVSYACLFGGPILMSIGVVGLAGTSLISYKQFKTDCTEYFNQYKQHYEEYKYYSIYNFINSIFLGIAYFENYLINLNDNSDKAAPSVSKVIDNFKKGIENDLKTASGTDKPMNNYDEIKENIPFLNN